MSPELLGFGSLGLVLLLIAVRMPIGVALGVASFLGFTILRNERVAFAVMAQTPFEVAANWGLSAIPMFILMGAIAHSTGISEALFKAARLWLSALPGGLAVATNLASAGFAAASGSSVATSATMGRLAIPEMLKAGYAPTLATGVVASSGTLGALIPPSIMFVIYGVFAEVSITKLLIAGVIPGLLTAFVYTVMIIGALRMGPLDRPAHHQRTAARRALAGALAGAGADLAAAGADLRDHRRALWRRLHPDRGGGGGRVPVLRGRRRCSGG